MRTAEEQYCYLAILEYLRQLAGGASNLEFMTAVEQQYATGRGTFTYANEDNYTLEVRILLADFWPKIGRLAVYLHEVLPDGLVGLHQTGEYVFRVVGDPSAPEIKSPWLSKELSDRIRKKDGLQ